MPISFIFGFIRFSRRNLPVSENPNWFARYAVGFAM
jgi:hypothetical protein